MRDEEFDIPPDTADHEPIYQLVVGERRLHAIRKIYQTDEATFSHDGVVVPHGLIPVTDLGLDDAASVFEAELHENIIRVDLDWKDRVRAIDDLHKLRQTQNPTQTVQDTAAELNPVSPKSGMVRDEIARARVVAERMDDPAIAGARSANEAYNLASRQIEAEFLADLANRGLSSKGKHELFFGDCVDVMQDFINADTKFDLIIADPPYGMGADKFGDAAKNVHTYKDDRDTAIQIAKNIFDLGYKATKDDAHLYLFCDIDNFTTLRDVGSSCEWDVFRTPLIWNKLGGAGHAPIGARGFQRTYELLLFASKGHKPFASLYSDVMTFNAVNNKVYAAQKPEELYKHLIKQSCLPQSLVLDPTCGMGTVFRAAQAAGCTGYGIEINKEAHGLALITLDELNKK
jgi:DNA modification methylase